VADRDYLSIGEVLVNLRPEFPDVTISKIRFLESEGLIAPDRTDAGYRKFFEGDVERLRQILRLQRDEYLPLRVIKERLDHGSDGAGARMTDRPREPEDSLDYPATEVQMTPQELATAAGLGEDRIEELESFGLLRSRTVNGTKLYDGDALVLLGILKDFFKFGVEARHLTMYRHFADREAAFFEAIILPTLRQRNPEARRAAAESITELARVSRRLKQALLRSNLKDYLAEA
jgi:DNA-binding transcriptional MerR regulator